MKKADLYQILQYLSEKQIRSLQKFICSPYHNHRKDVKNLFSYLKRSRSNSHTAVTFENAHSATYPNQPFDLQQLRYCMSYLMKVIEQFLIVQEATADQVQNQLYLTNAYRKLGLEKQTRRSLDRAFVLQKKLPQEGIDFYEKNYLLETEQYNGAGTKKRTAPRNLQQINHSLDLAFLAKKLKQSCLALSHGAIANVEYDTGLLQLVLSYLENADWLDEHPAIGLYFYYYQAATKQEQRYFEKLKKGLSQTGYLLPTQEQRSLFLLAINYGIQQFNKGNEDYLHEVFDLYREALEKGVLLENGQLSRFAFKNIAGIAIRLGEFAWTDGFIKQYNKTIEPRHRRNYSDFNWAKLYFAQKQYDKAQQLLQKIEYEDVFLNLDAKVMLLKIYFETEELNVLDSFIRSFSRFLQRKKGLGYHRENYLNTLLFAQRLIDLNPFDKKEKKKLVQEIEETKALGEKEWLLEQL